MKSIRVSIDDLIKALEGASSNTDEDPRWKAASTLRGLSYPSAQYVTIVITEERKSLL